MTTDAEYAATFEMPLDPGIARAVRVLADAGVCTIESCEGGAGHAFPDPTVVFGGNTPEGWFALSVAIAHHLPVCGLRRVWHLVDGQPEGPWWELVFRPEIRDGGTDL